MNEDSSISCRGNIDLITLYGIKELKRVFVFCLFFQVLEKVTRKGRWLGKENLYQYCILLFNITSYWCSLSICKSFGTKNIKARATWYILTKFHNLSRGGTFTSFTNIYG